jgi:hypothetical protein
MYAALGEFFNVYIRAVEATGRAQVLSRPFVFTANNKEANISVGRRIPVPSNSQTNTIDNTTTLNTNVEYEDVNLEIIVTPLINSKNEVTLTITEINDGLGPERQVGEPVGARNHPAVPDHRNHRPQRRHRRHRRRHPGNVTTAPTSGIPWLARVPVLRGLLGNTTKGRRRSELLFFIQPRIVETSEELEGMHTDQLRRTAVGKNRPGIRQTSLRYQRNHAPHRNRRHPPRRRAHPAPQSTGTATHRGPTRPPPRPRLLTPPTRGKSAHHPAQGRKTPPRLLGSSRNRCRTTTDPHPNPQKSRASRLLPWNWGRKTEAGNSRPQYHLKVIFRNQLNSP